MITDGPLKPSTNKRWSVTSLAALKSRCRLKVAPLCRGLLEHLDDDPFPVQYRLWKGKWQAFADEFGYWQGVLFGFSLGIILLKGVERGEKWSSLTERLYADVGFRREVATLLVPTEQVMLCDLLAMGVSEMDADLKLTVNTRWNLT